MNSTSTVTLLLTATYTHFFLTCQFDEMDSESGSSDQDGEGSDDSEELSDENPGKQKVDA